MLLAVYDGDGGDKEPGKLGDIHGIVSSILELKSNFVLSHDVPG